MKKKATPLAIVVGSIAIAVLGVYQRSLDPMHALALVASSVTIGAGMHAHARRRARKAQAKPNEKNGAKP